MFLKKEEFFDWLIFLKIMVFYFCGMTGFH
jgi:hypothetical protein